MQSVLRRTANTSLSLVVRSSTGQTRHASLTGAISRGLREGQNSAESRRGAYNEVKENHSRRWIPATRSGNDAAEQRRNDRPRRSSHPYRDSHDPQFDEIQQRQQLPNDHAFRLRRSPAGRDMDMDECHDAGPASWQRSSSKQLDYITEAPRGTPYTFADSEFVYGTYAVDAAIRARRRKLHKLYVYAAEDGGVRSDVEKNLQRLATKAGITVVNVGGPEWKQKLSQLAGGRAHNGFVLEASPLPIPKLKSCNEVEYAGAKLSIVLDDGTTMDIEAKSDRRFPLLLLLDSVTDPGNVGAVLRSSYFFGIDGVLTTEFGSSAATSVIAKASAGSAEFMPTFRVRNEVDFLRSSQENGWHIATAMASDAQIWVPGNRRPRPASSKATPDRILDFKPTILVLGNEGDGVRPKLSKLSDSYLSIQDAPGAHSGLDSLNVSVAAAILMRDLVGPFLLPNRSKESLSQAEQPGSDSEDIF